MLCLVLLIRHVLKIMKHIYICVSYIKRGIMYSSIFC